MSCSAGGRQNHPQITQSQPRPVAQTRLLTAFSLRNLWMALVVALVFAASAAAQTRRVVIIKCDGLPYDLVDSFVKQRDKSTGKSALPWIDYIFYQRGSRLSSFYVRGMS